MLNKLIENLQNKSYKIGEFKNLSNLEKLVYVVLSNHSTFTEVKKMVYLNELFYSDILKVNLKVNFQNQKKEALSYVFRAVSSNTDINSISSNLNSLLLSDKNALLAILKEAPFLGEVTLNHLKMFLLNVRPSKLPSYVVSLLNSYNIVYNSSKQYIDFLSSNLDNAQLLDFYLYAWFDSFDKEFSVKHSTSSNILFIKKLLESKKVEDIKIYDFEQKASFYDYFVVGTVNPKQGRAVLAKIKEEKISIRGIEAQEDWYLIDMFDVIIHLFSPEARKYYDFDSRLLGTKQI
ncbi:MAG: ribosome silencing factor [Acholeplasmatales bacterium]|jgi:ribosome-associated protein|nr:ribosome silencing factor [Acholeplasmatales bacterium]